MSKIAFIYPGQGAQAIGMGADFYEKSPLSKAVFDQASEVVSLDLKKLCFEENDLLNKTEYTQVAMVTACLAMTRDYLKLEKEGASFEELEQLTLGSLRKAVIEGDAVHGSLMAGQIAGMIKEERTCADIISSTVSEAGKLMNGVSANE